MRYIILIAIAVLLPTAAQARHHRHYDHHRYHHNYGRHVVAYQDYGTVVGGRPAGCPHAYCGCSASLRVFGKIIPYLNLAANWIRHFPRTEPAPGMVAARNHHVMVLEAHISGSNWMVHDGNSGHHLTREHVRSIANYVIVNPHAERTTRSANL